MPTRLEPKLITVLREGYTKKQFSADLIAGVIVGIVALPLAIAFAIASGVKPEQGLYTAVIAGLVIGSSAPARISVGAEMLRMRSRRSVPAITSQQRA